MIRDGLRTGRFGTGQTLIDATSGNTGIAYAMLGASLGFKVALAMPANASRPRKDILRAYGADVILTDWLEGTDGARRHAAELAARHPDRYFYPDQYNNDANWRAHYVSTGPEIIKQTAGRVTHFVASLGTTGTFTGVVRRLRADMRGVRSVAVQPDSPMHGIEGVKHLETADVPGIFDASLVDEQIVVSTEEAATETARLAQAEGLLVGTSSGANVAAAAKLARTLETGVIVTVLCDTGTRYLGESTH
jgi:cysteine synthase B